MRPSSEASSGTRCCGEGLMCRPEPPPDRTVAKSLTRVEPPIEAGRRAEQGPVVSAAAPG